MIPSSPQSLHHIFHHLRPSQSITLRRTALTLHATCPVETIGPAKTGGAALGINDPDLAIVTLLVIAGQNRNGSLWRSAIFQ